MRDREICRTLDDKSMAIYGPERDSQEEPEVLGTEVELSTIEASCWISMTMQKESDDRAREMTESSFDMRKLEERADEIKVVMTEVDKIELDETEVGEIEVEGKEVFETEVRDTEVVDTLVDETQVVDKEKDEYTQPPTLVKEGGGQIVGLMICFTSTILWLLRVMGNHVKKTARNVKEKIRQKLLDEDEDVTGQELETVGAIVLEARSWGG